MNGVVHAVRLEMNKPAQKTSLSMRRGDTCTQQLRVTLSRNGAVMDLSRAVMAIFKATKPDGTLVYNDCTLSGNEIFVNITNQTIIVAGEVTCNIEVTFFGTDEVTDFITSPEFYIHVYDNQQSQDDYVESTNEYQAAAAMVSISTFNANRADTAALQCEATLAHCNEVAAQVTADRETADERATEAINAADRAALYANNAENSAETAVNAAETAAQEAVDNVESLLIGYVEQAEAYAQSADEDADRAEDAADDAEAQKEAAIASAEAAEISNQQAALQADRAEDEADDAENMALIAVNAAREIQEDIGRAEEAAGAAIEAAQDAASAERGAETAASDCAEILLNVQQYSAFIIPNLIFDPEDAKLYVNDPTGATVDFAFDSGRLYWKLVPA